ncbi:methyl-accepting chemotaxis sensory transducer [Methanospirillum hungatei JF-1]|uniref:Methyl-accepting chemotaxis sensory transducer n=1 Tax=Methanospirillum hungatei JF-1 (strain ATCC 27890 / DSM 864 / NBRC 100397 / JF-1) TaxID=323259 RepID=Q2FRC3_METHJ|nr:methyl-accepting chemotaxis protein [Methanospirillum hungatei]ABD40435.1 methyl-accepting chemotaxis sensory transducer [Methanospirillum hungatei JF-1]
MFLDNIPMKKKLIGGFLCVILLAILIALVGYMAMGDMTEQAKTMYDDNLVSLEQLLNADNSFLNIRINIYKTVFAKDERKDKFAEIDDEIINIKSKIEAYKSQSLSLEESALIEEFERNWPVFETNLRKIIDDMNNGREEAALEGIYSKNFSVPRDAAQDALDNLEIYNQEKSKLMRDDIVRTYQESSLLFFVIVLLTLIFGIGLALLLTRSITSPLSRAVTMIQEMNKGHLGMRLDMIRKDEIGQMAETMDSFANNLQKDVIGSMQKIAQGEKISHIPIVDDKDEIGPALRVTADTISNLIDETEKMVSAAKDGNLSIRGDETLFKGAYRDIIKGFNATLENLLVPINEAMALSKEYARGNFTARFSEEIIVKGDFIPFKDALNTIGTDTGSSILHVRQEVESLLGTIEETNASSEEIAAGSRTLALNANQVSDLSEKSSHGIEQILSAMNDLAAAVSSVATETTDVAGLTQKTNNLSMEGTKLVQKTGEGMKNIKESFEATNQVVQEIDEQMGEIGSIVELISGIADQTNLLALNAAIEAARAGDAGLGFAVVANEVKALAEESRVSAERIAELIAILQKKSKNVTTSMNRSLEDVTTGDAAVQEMMTIFEHIADSIEIASKRVSDVAANTQEQAASVEEITASVHELELLAKDTSQEAISSSAATEEISASIDHVSRSISDASSSLQKISQEMNKFKI